MALKFLSFLVTALILLGCSLRGFDSHKGEGQFSNVPTSSNPSPEVLASSSSSRYAFFGEVVDEKTQEPISNFSVDLIQQDGAVNALLNALGQKAGQFFISRNPTDENTPETLLPLLISASGYEPLVKWVRVGADCKNLQCVGQLPELFSLIPSERATEISDSIDQLFPKSIDLKMLQQGTLTIFKDLIAQGRIDPAIQGLLLQAANGDRLQNVLVMLKAPVGGALGTDSLVTSLLETVNAGGLSGIKSQLPALLSRFPDLAKKIAAYNPKLGNSLLAANQLLPYLSPLLGKLGSGTGTGGLLSSVLQGVTQNGSLVEKLVQLGAALKGFNPGGSNLAALGLLPQFQSQIQAQSQIGIPAIPGLSGVPFGQLLNLSLKDKAMLDVLKARAKQDWEDLKNGNIDKIERREKFRKMVAAIGPFIQPLIQGLIVSQNPMLGALFNQFSPGTASGLNLQGLSLLQNSQFAQLTPYFEPLLQGLQGQNSDLLAQFLNAFLKQSDPAASLKNFLTNNPNVDQMAELSAQVFPGLQNLLKESVAAKQLLTAQLLAGLTDGTFQDVSIIKDLRANSAVIVSGRARDIFKLAQLPNVDRLIQIESP